jgi:hypothetical protein
MKIRLVREGAAAVAVLLAAACSGGAPPEDAPVPGGGIRPGAQEETAGFVVTLGDDTLAVERFTRAGDQLTGEVVSRSPRTVVRSYTATLRPDGSVARVELTSRTPGTQAPPTTTTTEFTADSAFSRTQRGDSVVTSRIAVARGVPMIGSSHVFYEQAVMQARAAGAPELRLSHYPPGANTSYPLRLRVTGADSLLIDNLSGVQRVRADARGRLLELNGMESTQKFIVTRVPTVDVEQMAAEFARRDAAGQGFGPLSPRDSAVAEIGGARVAIDYGRPFKRGRTIFGEVVPWNQVWRTGANAATGFRTTRDLEIGGVTVPAGAYTLWSLPSPTGWKLILNRQVGQWGTEYRPELDLARFDMQTRRLSAPVEKFTIRIEPSGSGGTLNIAWDDTEAFVPFTVK